MTKKHNFIAIDPGLREMGFAHFEGDDLIDYGVKSLRRPKQKRKPLDVLRGVMTRFIEEKHPDVIALEKNSFAQIPQNQPLVVAIKLIHKIALDNNTPIYEYAPNTIKKEVCQDGRATKRLVSKIVSMRYPELNVYRGSNSRLRELYYFNMFDAVACGLTYLKYHDGK